MASENGSGGGGGSSGRGGRPISDSGIDFSAMQEALINVHGQWCAYHFGRLLFCLAQLVMKRSTMAPCSAACAGSLPSSTCSIPGETAAEANALPLLPSSLGLLPPPTIRAEGDLYYSTRIAPERRVESEWEAFWVRLGKGGGKSKEPPGGGGGGERNPVKRLS